MDLIPYLIATFRGGISDETNKGVAGSYKFGQALDIHGRDDILTAKQAMASITPAGMNDLVQFFVPASDGTTYCFGRAGSIWAQSGDGVWTFAYNDENGNIVGAAEWKLSTGVDYLFWATTSSIARKEIQGNGVIPWTDAIQDNKTSLSLLDYHTMHIGSGLLCIANGESVATFDFDGNFNVNQLNIRPGNLIKALEERDDYLIMGSYRKDNAEEGHIWSWISSALVWLQKKKIPVKGINSMITAEIMLLQGGSNGEIFFADFVNNLAVNALPGGGQTLPGGVTIDTDIPIFGFFGGTYPGLWSYGRRRKDRPLALNYDYRLVPTVNGSLISTIGALAMINGVILASWGTTDGSTSEYGIDSSSSTNKATAIFEGLEFNGGNPHLKKRFNTVKLNLTPLVAGTSVSVKYKLDKQSSWQYAILGDGTTTFSQSAAVEAIFNIGGIANTYEVGVELNPSGNNSPEVHAITTYITKENYEFA